MNKHIEITVRVPVFKNGNFDSISEGLEAARKDLNLLDVIAIMGGETRTYEFSGPSMCGEATLKLV